MKTLSSVLTRRDRCYLFAIRASKLSPQQAQHAWYHLSGALESLSYKHIPNFNDLLIAIRVATVSAKRRIKN